MKEKRKEHGKMGFSEPNKNLRTWAILNLDLPDDMAEDFMDAVELRAGWLLFRIRWHRKMM